MIVLLMLILPAVSIGLDYNYHQTLSLFLLMGKWVVFWSIGFRLLLAGLRQTAKPEFTAKQIFNLDGNDSLVVIRELGFANICFGSLAIISIFIPFWRSAAAFCGGLYMGIAGIYHIIKKPSGLNEIIAMVSDLFVFVVLAIYLYAVVINNNIQI